MKIRSIFLSFCLFSLLLACESENTQLKEEVIAIHDEVMPHMEKLKSLQKQFTEKAEQLAVEDSAAQQDQILDLRNTSDELGEAYDGMFGWMRQFEPERDERTEEEFNAYLKEQKVLVEKVKQDINKALEKANNLD